MDYNEKMRRDSFQQHLDELLEEGDTEQLHKAATMLNEAQGSSAMTGSYAATTRRAEPPTEEGWYWYRFRYRGEWSDWRMEYVGQYHGELKISQHEGAPAVHELDAQWAGPIPKPTPEGEAEGGA